MGKKETNKKNNDQQYVSKPPVAPVKDSSKKTNAYIQQSVTTSEKIDSKPNNNIQIEKLKMKGMTLRSHRKYLENYEGMQLRSHPKIEFKHLD